MAAAPDSAWTELGLGIMARRWRAESLPGSLWLVDAGAPPAPGCEAVLSASERARAEEFRGEDLRNRFLTAHCALRLVLEQAFGVPVLRQTFELGPFGKPRLREDSRAQFSLSYSGDRALIGVAWDVLLGVDLESLRSIEGAKDIVSELFTPSEQLKLQRHDPASRLFDHAFLEAWTRKEACVKATGLGLGQIRLSELESGVGSGLTAVRIGSCHLRTDTTLIDYAYVAAWAVGTKLTY